MKLDADRVKYVAKLARLALSDDEVERFRAQLSAILSHVEQLNRLETKNVEPTSHATDIANYQRSDVVLPSLPADRAVANAATKTDTAVTVPRILD